MDTRARLRSYIIDTQGWSGSPADLSDDYLLIDNGVIDSLGIFQIVEFLEQDLGVVVDDEDLIPENFASIAAIATFVQPKLAA